VTLATLTFDALAPGATTIDFASVLLGDGFGVRITPNTVTGSTLPVIPEPGAVLLFGLGAAIVGARIWRGRSR